MMEMLRQHPVAFTFIVAAAGLGLGLVLARMEPKKQVVPPTRLGGKTCTSADIAAAVLHRDPERTPELTGHIVRQEHRRAEQRSVQLRTLTPARGWRCLPH